MVKESMQAIRVHQHGGPEQLKLEVVPCPLPQEGEVLVRVRAIGVLPSDWKMRQGFSQAVSPVSFPYIPGSAFSGIVEEVGPGVTGFQKGQAVFGRSSAGTYAEYTTVPVTTLAHKPQAISFADAATISGGATTAWAALFACGNLQAGQRVLIHGAAGGVGLFAVQFARLQGAQVIGTASTSNVDFVYSLGAQSVLDYTAVAFEQTVHEVDLVLDTIGGAILRRSMQVVRCGGTLVSLLEQPPQEQARALGIRAVKFTVEQPFPSSLLLQKIADLLDKRCVKTVVARLLPLREAWLAHKLSQTSHGRGRIVLYIAG